MTAKVARLLEPVLQQPATVHKAAIASESSNTQWHVADSKEFVFSGTDNGLKNDDNYWSPPMKRYKLRFVLRDKCKTLENVSESSLLTDPSNPNDLTYMDELLRSIQEYMIAVPELLIHRDMLKLDVNFKHDLLRAV
ncbi:hypothetical protein AB4K20DRAFT_1961951 [Rhizopus microsporus]|uniref:Uncharacterized protein n=2 Tax=Rhizopus TaxID=4842 RepID=A0A1X0S8C9_RHIZD|nr:hypothetical protein BCV71DRAFT_261972 [Rhizopus microsporus]